MASVVRVSYLVLIPLLAFETKTIAGFFDLPQGLFFTFVHIFSLPREKGWMLERQLEENFLSYFRLHFARLKSIQ